MNVESIRAMTPLIGIICVTLIELSALSQGIDGTLLAGTIGAICLLSGYKLPDMIRKIGHQTGP